MNKYTILYARLSQEDGKDGTSNSIENQQSILEKYAEDNGFENCKFMYDDGYSGTNFNRPAWNEVIKLVESHQVATLIVKDSSRLGRNYILMGQLTEITLPAFDVRYISISDGIDTLYGLDDLSPIRNVFHDMYAKDCSKKQRQVRRNIAERGGRVATRPAYGYVKCKDNPKDIEIDIEAAEVVEQIFRLCANGLGPTQIAKKLTKQKVVNPSTYFNNKYNMVVCGYNVTDPFKWTSSVIVKMLDNEIYLGHTVSLKTTTKSYKDKKKVHKPKDEWIRFENTHKHIIDQELWDFAHEVRKSKKRPRKNMDEPNMFSGMLFCMDCKEKMTVHRGSTIAADKVNFTCSTYKRKGKDVCSTHYIREIQLIEVILDDIKRVTHFARQNEEFFANYIAKNSSKQTKTDIEILSKKLKISKTRLDELQSLFKRLYEDNVLGKIPDEVFRQLSDQYLEEQKQLKIDIPITEAEITKLKSTLLHTDKFMKKAKEFLDIKELTPNLLRTFIERIEIGAKPAKYQRTGSQEIKIYYRGIGYLEDFVELIDTQELKKSA